MNPDIESTLIQTLLVRYKQDPTMVRPVSWEEYRQRMEGLHRLAHKPRASNNFSKPESVSPTNLRAITGMISSRMQRGAFKKEMQLPIPVVREMTMIAFEAKPRLVSLSLGFKAHDFICYIYQDVIMQGMIDEGVLTRAAAEQPFLDLLPAIKRWMRQDPPRKGKNSARRHIRRRLMALFDRTNHQTTALFTDKELASDIDILIQKLMERDDDVGYTEGEIRPFEVVRADFNALAEHCRMIRLNANLGLTSNDPFLFDRIVCPSTVSDLPNYQLDLPRGPASGLAAATKRAQENKRLLKTRNNSRAPLKPKTESTTSITPEVAVESEHDALLAALRKI